MRELKKRLSTYVDLSSGHFCDLICLRVHLPIISVNGRNTGYHLDASDRFRYFRVMPD